MDLRAIQQNVDVFVKENGLEAPVQARLLDLVSEVGEVSKEVLKATSYGRGSFQPREQWAEELADVFFTLICLSNSTGIDLGVALRGALEKYGERLAAGGDAGSSER